MQRDISDASFYDSAPGIVCRFEAVKIMIFDELIRFDNLRSDNTVCMSMWMMRQDDVMGCARARQSNLLRSLSLILFCLAEASNALRNSNARLLIGPRHESDLWRYQS